MRGFPPTVGCATLVVALSMGFSLSACALFVGDVDGNRAFPSDAPVDGSSTHPDTDAREAGRDGGTVDARTSDGRGPADSRTSADAKLDAALPVEAAVDAAHDAGSAYALVVLRDNPLAYWRLDESAGAGNALDKSGNVHTGLYEGDGGPGVPGLLTGDPDTAALFTATASNATIVVLGTTAAFDFSGKAPFSLEAWVKPASNVDVASTNYPRIFVREEGTGTSFSGYSLGLEGLEPRFARYEPDAGGTALGPSLTVGQRYHLVGTFDGANDCVYENGAQVACVPDTLSLGSYPNDNAAIGGDPGPYFQFGGVIDEVAVYGTALSSMQVLQHYETGTAP